MKKVVIFILAAMALGCQVENNEPVTCDVTSKDYVKTDFDCLTYSVEYVICNPESDQSQGEDCIEAYNIPEAHLTHCESYDICEMKIN